MRLISIFIAFLIVGCNYTTTSFFIDNQTSESVRFDATAILFHRQTFNTQSFAVDADQKVLLRNVDISQKVDITNLFTQINFKNIEVDSFSSPMNPQNWVESIDENGKRIFTYTIRHN